MLHQGSCHCGRIDIEVEGKIDQAMECNCTICSRKGYQLWFVPQAQLADAFAFEQHFGERTLWPAAAWQRGVEPRETRWQRSGLGRAIVAAPDRGIAEQRRKRGVHRVPKM